MQSLTLIQQLDITLSRELSPEGIQAYTDEELEQLWQKLRALQRHEKPLRLAADRIELAAFNADIDWLCTDHWG